MRKILVVDDNLDYLELLASVLGKYFEVHEATGVKDALRVLSDKEKEIEAICSDYNMRDGTGLDLLEKVRQEGITIPFLLMSVMTTMYLNKRQGFMAEIFAVKRL